MKKISMAWILLSPLFLGESQAAVDKIHCDLLEGKSRKEIAVIDGKNGTVLDEPAASLQDIHGHKVGAFYYKDDSLGLVINSATTTTYNASKMEPKLLTFLALKDGPELKCYTSQLKKKRK